MFESLPEIHRLCSSLSQLEKESSSLLNIIQKSNPNHKKVQQEVIGVIDDKIRKAKEKLELCEQLEKEIESGEFISTDFDVSELVYDVNELPEWFGFVFQKEFSKEKHSFDAIARKLYKQHFLFEKKNELAGEIKSFENLHRRYESLNEKEQSNIDINGEAQTFENRTTIILDRFINFIELVGSKILYFVEENVSKSLNYTNKSSKMVPESNNFQRQTFAQLNNTHYEPTHNKNFTSMDQAKLRSTMPTFKQENYSRQRAESPIFSHAQTTYGMLGAQGARCGNHFQVERNIIGNSGMQFNYRDHMPQWMNKSLGSFYS